jgi:hypothetical protein
MGHVEIFMWTRVTNGGTAIPGWARVPFICSFNGGFSLLSTDATTLQIINNNAQKVAPATVGATALIDKSEDYFWVGDTYYNAQGPAGKGMTSVVTDGLNATTNLLISGLSQSIIYGVPTVTLAIPTCAVDRWLIMHFTYTAIQSDAGE